MTSPERVWITPETRDRLQAELAELSESHAEAEAEDLDARRARQARIHQIHDLLSDAVVGEDPPDDGVAEPGMVLTVRYDGSDETETFLLGARGVEHGDMEVYSTQSPLGTAITGARPGEQCSYRVPSGATVSVTLVDAVPYGVHANGHPA